MVNGGGWIIFFPFLKKMSAISLPLRLQQTSSSFSLCLRYFFRENLKGQEGKLHSGIQKNKHFLQLQWGRGEMASARRTGGPWKVFCGGRERKKMNFCRKNFDPTTDEKKMFQNLFPSRISFFPICLFSSLLFSFPKKTKILFLLFKFPLR